MTVTDTHTNRGTATATAAELDVRPLTATIGAEIFGIDLAEPLTADTVAGIRRALLDHQVIFFPDQGLTPAEQVAFARYFGELTLPSAILPALSDEYPEIVQFDKTNFGGERRHDQRRDTGWHVDITFRETPPLGAVFQAVEVPAAGGDTMFASATAAYDRLSPSFQRFLDPLVAIHGYDRPRPEGPSIRWESSPDDFVEHPVVAVHPETGRKGLYVNPAFTRAIKGLSAAESDAVLDLLFEHTTRPEHVVRYHWRPGSVGFWDNRAVWHRRVDDFDLEDRRIVHRVQLRGTRPVGPVAVAG